jgi:LacI family transcriptional regulator
MRATLKDIAKQTGLSITTVSLVLNNKGARFPGETRDLVFDAARNLNYHPNQLAVGLLTKQTHTLGLIIPDITNVFFSELAKGLEDRSRQDRYNIILCNSNDEYLMEKQCINTLYDRGVDGIVLAMSAESFGAKNEECLSLLRSLDIPVVLVDSFNEAGDFSALAIDNAEGSRLAVGHLLELGHRRIACISGPMGIKTNRDRLDGYTETLRKAGLASDPALVFEGDFRYQSGYAAVAPLLEARPSAIFCHNDMMAYGAYKALKDRRLRVPGDISLMGFDDIFFSQYLDVPLSTVVQPAYEMGRQTADQLLGEIADREKPKLQTLFTPRLVIRGSAGAPPRSPGNTPARLS